jgi:U3 small nucleolar RNA-associated protein 14
MAKKQRSGRVYGVPTAVSSSSIASAQKSKKKRGESRPPPRRTLGDVYDEGRNDEDDKRDNVEKSDAESDDDMLVMNIDAEDDEEIDEDMAFDDEDEARWGDFFSKRETAQKQRRQVRFLPKIFIDLKPNLVDEASEEDEEEPSDFEDDADAIDLSEMFAAGAKASTDTRKPPKKSKNIVTFEDLKDESEHESELSEQFSASDEEMDVDRIDKLESLVKSLNDDDAAGKRFKRKRQYEVEDEVNEAYDESEFNLDNRADDKDELSLEALMASLADESGMKHIKKQLKVVESDRKAPQVAAPLATRLQDKVNRQAAYEASSKEVSKWLPMIQKNRQAEHLSFPMNETPAQTLTSASLSSKFKVCMNEYWMVFTHV